MKLKTLFKCLCGLAISISLIPVGMSFNNKTHLSNQNVGSLNQVNNEPDWIFEGSLLVPPHNYASLITGDIVIPLRGKSRQTGKIEDVKQIQYDFIKGCTDLKSVTFQPETKVQTITTSAFRDCPKLERVVLDGKINQISGDAFSGDTSLKEINLGANLKTFARSSFAGCTSLEHITLPNTVTTIGKLAFNGCTSLKDINVSWSMDELNTLSLGENIFNGITSNITIHAKNTNKQHDELVKKYQELFGSVTNVTIDVEADTNLVGPILGGVFGGIALVGLVSIGIVTYRKKHLK
ncbi:MAG: leucine-rich repeat domain-containing protein [Mycoplasma sp.]